MSLRAMRQRTQLHAIQGATYGHEKEPSAIVADIDSFNLRLLISHRAIHTVVQTGVQ